ncbi:MAG: hypothetical protein KIH69_018470 [Anaerolineae bacterium]|nr:hypothetical protein [Anaerolineae bacterium]
MMKLVVGTAAPNMTAKDVNGNSLALSTLWQAQPIVLSFLRHFG